ncbi:PspA-associated protein PspAB [Haloarchaeobius sp. TZWWS8]|uniref:PspA-associated protein PspAB n=1 Tax=Haloarchaeobius sp. TZWWS8 TaxID=3446121 RepID=UPI003EBB8658
MGLLDSLRAALGLKAEADATRDADPDDLFGMSTAYITMSAELGFDSTGDAALCFSSVDSTDFTDTVSEVEAILTAGEDETGTEFTVSEDDHGYHWVVLHDDDPEDLVTSIHFAADTFIDRGYGSRLLMAFFAFGQDDRLAYWVYSFRRGAYYPFVPKRGKKDRDSGTEFKLESNLDGELDLEKEKEYWYPMYASSTGKHPWE